MLASSLDTKRAEQKKAGLGQAINAQLERSS